MCTAGQQLCGGACFDTNTSAVHCGTCNVACAGGKICAAGNCVCPGGTQQCRDVCIDSKTDTANCGACDNKCIGGHVCINSACTCPAGQVECDGQCTEIASDANNCGACDQTCFTGESCQAGACRGPIGADGCNGPAQNLTVSEVAAYQAVKIPLSSGQREIAGTARVAEIVQGRETLFRIFVTLATGWKARELSARVTLTNATAQDQYYSKKTISQNSTDAQTSNTFQIIVPADKIQADTLSSFEVVECSQQTGGTTVEPRFPATGTVKLTPRKTGVVKIRLIPIQYNKLSPDTSDKVLSVYSTYLQAMYPATQVDITVGTELTVTTSTNWTTLLDQLRAKRRTEAPAADVYYFGLIKPAATLKEYCESSCTVGISYVAGEREALARVGLAAAFADEQSARTIAHELGHCHGQSHAPCAPGGQIEGIDPAYPYSGGSLGTWGYNSLTQTFIDPSKTKDIMGYCSPQWISDYTFRAFTKRIIALNTASFEIRSEAVQARWRVLLLDSQGPRWGISFDRPESPYGQPEELIVLDAQGNVIQTITGYRTLIAGSESAAMVLVPEPKTGWFAVQAQGSLPIEFFAPISVPTP